MAERLAAVVVTRYAAQLGFICIQLCVCVYSYQAYNVTGPPVTYKWLTAEDLLLRCRHGCDNVSQKLVPTD